MALKTKQLREESTDRLREMLAETQEALFKHNLRIASGEGVNPHEAREMRRDIARLRTAIRAVEVVAERGNVEAGAARTVLDKSGWDIKKAVAAAKSAGS